jgi:hypothetical protein
MGYSKLKIPKVCEHCSKPFEAKTAKPEAGKKQYRKKKLDAARLCADDVIARDKLKSYQDNYAEAMQKYGLQRGIEGSEARHITTPQYYRELFHENELLKENIQEEELNLIHELFPMIKEPLRIAVLCRKVGLAVESIKALLTGKTLTAKSFSFFSPEHKRKFTAEDVKLKIEKEPNNPNKLRLNINGMNILDWFKQRFEEVQKAMENRNKQANSNIKQIKL